MNNFSFLFVLKQNQILEERDKQHETKETWCVARFFSGSKAAVLCPQSKYKEAGKKELVNSLYSLLPETKDTQHAKEQTQLHSEVRNNPPTLRFKFWLLMIIVIQSPFDDGFVLEAISVFLFINHNFSGVK